MFIFTKGIAEKLAKLRKESLLSQKEVALRMGINPKTGQSYIAQLEKGMIKYPYLSTILNYLDAIGGSWESFFRELSVLRSKQNHQEIMAKVKLPSDVKLQKKLDRDTFLYETKIKPPQNFYTKVDIELVKKKVDLKIREYLRTLQVKDSLIPHYLSFAFDILNTSKYTSLIEKYHISGISKPYLIKIINIVNKIHNAEKKKVQKQKPLRLEKARTMAVKPRPLSTQGESQSPHIKSIEGGVNFARECFGKIRKFYIKNPLLLKQHLSDITRAWLRSGLKPEIMEKIKETVLKSFAPKDNI